MTTAVARVSKNNSWYQLEIGTKVVIWAASRRQEYG